MKLIRSIIAGISLSLLIGVCLAQDSNVKHYDKDGLSFDFPANWQFSDQSTGQMQYIQMARDGFAEIRIRAPREWLKTPEKEAAARKLIQDQYVDNFANRIEKAGMNPKRSAVTTQISGADAQGARIRAVMDGQPGGMDSYFNIVSDRLVQMSIIGSEREITRSAPVWDMIRNSLKVAPPPEQKPTPSPTPKSQP